MDYRKCVEFVHKYGSRGEFHDLTRVASKPYRSGQTTIHLTYFSMPDWLAIISAARSPQASDDKPNFDVLRAMAMESNISAVLDFLWLECLEPSSREWLFRRLVIGYRRAAEQHQQSVAACLDAFAGKGAGRALLAELGRTRHTITVMPHWLYFLTLPGHGFRNATVRGLRAKQILSHVTDGIDRNDADTFAKGARFDNPRGSGTLAGTGRGASVVVYYSAGAFTDTIYTDYTTGAAGFEPDEVLFHELVHVTRMIRGQQTFAAIEGRGNYGNIEEYFCTVITNIYLSEKGARLVGVYAAGGKDPPRDWNVMKDPDSFYDNTAGASLSPNQLMDTFERTQQQFYHDLAALQTPKFNPARVHFKRSQRIPV